MSSQGKWSTERIEKLIANYDKTGVMPKNNPFYEGKTYWRDAGINYSYTYDETLELARIKRDILYFGETHCHVMTDEGTRVVQLRKYQKKVLLQYRTFKNNVYLASRQVGKCVTFDTMVMISDTKTGNCVTIPIYELHYMSKNNRNFLDTIEYLILKSMHRVKLEINKHDNKFC